MLQACFPTAVQNRPTGKEKLEIDHRYYKLISRLDSTAPWQLALPGEDCPDSHGGKKKNKKVCKIQPVGVWTSFLVGCCSERFYGACAQTETPLGEKFKAQQKLLLFFLFFK